MRNPISSRPPDAPDAADAHAGKSPLLPGSPPNVDRSDVVKGEKVAHARCGPPMQPMLTQEIAHLPAALGGGARVAGVHNVDRSDVVKLVPYVAHCMRRLPTQVGR